MVAVVKLNLGCGRDDREGWINVDHWPGPGVDVVYDLDEMPWPFQTGEASYALMDNVMEHLREPEEVLRELTRVVKHGGLIEIVVPHYLSPAAHRPNHRSTWSASSFNEYDAEDHGGRKGLDAKPWFDVVEMRIMHRRPHGLWLPWAVPVLGPQKIRWVLRRRH